jgi:hypothetical protein
MVAARYRLTATTDEKITAVFRGTLTPNQSLMLQIANR